MSMMASDHDSVFEYKQQDALQTQTCVVGIAVYGLESRGDLSASSAVQTNGTGRMNAMPQSAKICASKPPSCALRLINR